MILLSSYSCKQEVNSAKSIVQDKISKASNSDLAAKLYQNYTANPTSQAQKDENLIIDYLVTRNLDFERYSSGLYVQVNKKGSGPKYIKGQPAKADYRGFFLNGKIFDSSFARDEPINFQMGQMNEGWNQAMSQMNPGTETSILVPSYLAYGEKGFPGYVEPNTVIGFDIYFKHL